MGTSIDKKYVDYSLVDILPKKNHWVSPDITDL